MKIPKTIRHNLQFLIAETVSQLGSLRDFLETASIQSGQQLLDRSGYAQNLKNRIHESCLQRIARCKINNTDSSYLRAVESVASDLERITDCCRNVVIQANQVEFDKSFRTRDFSTSLDRVARRIEKIDKAMRRNDTKKILKIGKAQIKLDRLYQRVLIRYTRKLKLGRKTEVYVSLLMVAGQIKQMGNALLDISQTLLSAGLGQPISIDSYQSLMAGIDQIEPQRDDSELEVQPLAETRSGSSISAISTGDDENGQLAVFKDGVKRKLREERDGLQSWHEIYPGLAPRVLSYHKHGNSAAMLIEHLAGQTFEQILLGESSSLLDETLQQMETTLASVWKQTRRKQQVSANSMKQLQKRLAEVYRIHPEFDQNDVQVGKLEILAFDSLMLKAQRIEEKIRAPFSVYIHGDFNVDNIIYDVQHKKINFIDLHRSCYLDYVQDISVLMVSMYRLQVLDTAMRQRLLDVACRFYEFAAEYAHKAKDKTFQMRLALGLARSFATSTRFILDKTLARAMFVRARYLLEKAVSHGAKNADSFQLSTREIFIV